MLQFNLNALLMFDAAARHLSFRAAADELNVTQGAVAQRVRGLEERLGVKLFSRHARGLALTPDGAAYHPPVRKALQMIEEATKVVRSQRPAFTVSVPPSFATKWLVPRLASFTSQHPSLRFQTLASEDLSTFEGDGVDLAVRMGKPPFGEGLESKLIARLEICAVCAPSYPSALAKFNELRAFAAERLIQDGHKLWDKLLLAEGLRPREPYLEFNQTGLAIDAAIGGQGIALVPQLLVRQDLAAGRLAALWRPTFEEDAGYYAVWPKSGGPAQPRADFVDWLIEEAAESRLEQKEASA